MGRVTTACPILAAADPLAAAAWYRDRLGCEISATYPHEGYAIVHLAEVELHFWRCEDRHVAENTSVYLRVEGIEQIYQRLAGAAKGGRISAIEDRPWGMREFYIWDPDGNLLRFGEPIKEKQANRDRADHLSTVTESLSPEKTGRRVELAGVARPEPRS